MLLSAQHAMSKLIKALGILLALLAGIYFLVYARRALAGQDLTALLDGRSAMAVAALTVVYALSIFTTVVAWSRLLHAMHQPASIARLTPILATTQFGKYLPGNVAQHIGRIALVRKVGVQFPAAVLSVAYELLLVLLASAHIGALTLLWAPPDMLATWSIFRYRAPLLIAITGGAIVALALAPRITAWLVRLRSSDESDAAPKVLHLDIATVLACYLLYASSFVMIGCGLWLVAHTLGGSSDVPSALFFIGSFAASWVVGFIAPGAPAGLGIREALLSAWLGTALPPAEVVLLVVMLRIATTLGDLINFTWGSVFMLRQRRL